MILFILYSNNIAVFYTKNWRKHLKFGAYTVTVKDRFI